ncbi:MAG: hypothetical protein ACRDIV_06160 [Ktedonobacteraceae bacterium]
MNENGYAQQHSALPAIVLGFGDIAAINNIVRAYIAYARRTVPPSQQREIECHLLEGVSMRLAGMRPDTPEVSLVLMVSEMRALNNALLGFADFVRKKVPPSQERDETLQDIERFRIQLARLLPTRPIQA